MTLRDNSAKRGNGNHFWNRLAVLSFLGLGFLIILIEFPGSASCGTTPATYFVLAGGAGNCSGSDWNNAAGKIPSSLSAGDIVYLGGSTGNLANAANTPCPGERKHTFLTSGTSGSHIQIIKCTSLISACTSALGWIASYGTSSAFWNETAVPSSGGRPDFWLFCGSYYDITGSYGTSDQTGTYGIFFQSTANQNFIEINPNSGCGNTPQSNYTFQFIEMNGTTPNTTGNGAFGGSSAFSIISPVSTSAVISNVTIGNLFAHDIFEPFSILNVNGLVIANSWIYRNFVDATQHSQGMQAQSVGLLAANMALNNFSNYNTVWRNIMGTGILVCLSGTCDNWKVYNNVVWYDSTWNSTNCAYGDATARCGITKFVGDNVPGSSLANSFIYGNTIAFHKNVSPCACGASDAGIRVGSSTSLNISVENNLWFGNEQVNIYNDAAGTIFHDYNLVLNSPSTAYFTPNAHEMKTASGTADPFVSSSTGNFRLATAGSNSPTGCVAGTNCLANGVPLASPYNLDLLGGARGGTNGWTKGAYQFGAGSVSGTGPNPPTFLTATVQ